VALCCPPAELTNQCILPFSKSPRSALQPISVRQFEHHFHLQYHDSRLTYSKGVLTRAIDETLEQFRQYIVRINQTSVSGLL